MLVRLCHVSAGPSGSRDRVRSFWKQWGGVKVSWAGGAPCRKSPREGPVGERERKLPPWLRPTAAQKANSPRSMPTEIAASEQGPSKGRSDVSLVSVPASASCPSPSGSLPHPATGCRTRASRAGQPGEQRSLSAVFPRALGRSPHFCIISSSRQSHPVPVSRRALHGGRAVARGGWCVETGIRQQGRVGPGRGCGGGQRTLHSSRPRPGVTQGLGRRQHEGFQQTGGGEGLESVLRAGVEAKRRRVGHLSAPQQVWSCQGRGGCPG